MPDFLSALRAEILWARGLDWRLPEPPPEPPDAGDLRLRAVAASRFGALPPVLTVDEVRSELASVAADYAASKPDGILLVKVPAGVGKSHGLVQVAQDLAADGGRVLWAGQDHSAWDDLAQFPNFDPEIWQHWQGLLRCDAAGRPLCRYASSMQTWLARGYAARELCTRLCLGDGWMEAEDGCGYWAQTKCGRPCVFGQHAHVVFGVPVERFSLAIVDELPLKAFVHERVIPWRTGVLPIHGRLRGRGTSGALFSALADVQWRCTDGAGLDGRALLDIIGPALRDIYAAIETGFWQAPAIPEIFEPGDVAKAEYFFLHDLLAALALEFEAWRAGWPDWAHRVWATPTALHILGRHGLWDDLPRRVIVLDATAQEPLYKMMFRRRVVDEEGEVRWRQRGIARTYAPRVARTGQLFQVTGRTYSKRQLYKITRQQVTRHEDGREERSQTVAALPALHDAASTVAALARKHGARRVGLVTYQACEQLLREAIAGYGLAVASRHFYNVRGTNTLRDVDLLAVVGSPTPQAGDLIKIATALDAGRQRPFVLFGADGEPLPLFGLHEVEFRLTADGLAQWRQAAGVAEAAGVVRLVGGYEDDQLLAIHEQLRAAEVLQAAHRGRVNIQDVPVYILTSTPVLDEPLDGVFDTPPVGPDAIPWRTWLRLLAWLDTLPEGTRITTADVAAAARVDVDYARNKKWLAAIEQWFAGLTGPERGLWARPELLEKKGRGRPAFTLGKADKEL